MSTRTVIVSEGALRNHHFRLSDVIDFFPQDSVGGKNRDDPAARFLKVDFGGGLVSCTDIAGDKKIFRDRKTQREFFERHGVQGGDRLTLERISTYEYRIRLAA